MSGRDDERWEIRVIHIRDAIRSILEFVADMNLDDFKSDNKTVYAVIRCFQIMGEAAKKVPPDVRMRYSAVDWKHMAAFRDVLVHDYNEIDLDMTWSVITDELPRLHAEIMKIPVSQEDQD